jgi:short-subunit dehydrogenase
MHAVVTGASRGIGESYARKLAERGYALHLVARDGKRLAGVAGDLRSKHRVQVEEIILDLAQPDSAERLYMETRSRRNGQDAIDLLVNNAGFGLYGEYIDSPMPRLQEMLYLHIVTLSKVMRLFLPEMRERKSGAIINVASIAGLMPVPYMGLYAASKAFMVSLSVSIAHEVRPYGVLVQTCCPGQTLTDFHATAGSTRPYAFGSRQTPDQVVDESLAALDRRHSIIVTGRLNRLLVMAHNVIPRPLLLWAAARHINPSRKMV